MVSLTTTTAKDKSSDSDSEIKKPVVLDISSFTDDQKAFFEALQKALSVDLNARTIERTSILPKLAENFSPQTDFASLSENKEIVFENKASGNKFRVSSDIIAFEDGNSKFTFSDAMEMAKFAALDTKMQIEGITINDATKAQRALIERAIAEVNKSLETSNQIKVNNPIKLDMGYYRDPAEKQAQKYFKENGGVASGLIKKKYSLNFIQDRQAEPITTEQAATSTIKNDNIVPIKSSFEDATLLTDDQYAKVVEHVHTQKKATIAVIKEGLMEAGVTSGITRLYKEAATRLESEDFVEKVEQPGAAPFKRIYVGKTPAGLKAA